MRVQQQLEVVRASNEQEAKDLAGRLHVERKAARAQLAPVAESAWWDQVGAREITQEYTTAKARSDIDPDAERAVERIRDEVRGRSPYRGALEARARARHDVDVQLSDHQVQPWERLSQPERERAVETRAWRADTPPASVEFFEAKMLLDMADRIEKDADDARDTDTGESDRDARNRNVLSTAAERRWVLAAGLIGNDLDGAVAATCVRADTSQAKPATEATRMTSGRSPRSRRTRGGQSQLRQHSGIDKLSLARLRPRYGLSRSRR